MATGQEILHLKLMSYKNKGKTYVRAYRNKWIAPIPEEAALGKKGRSVPAVQIQVGVIQPSGMVKMSSKFLSLHPEFAQQDWYYLNHDLGKLFKNPCSQAELNKIVPFGFSLQRQKMVFFCH